MRFNLTADVGMAVVTGTTKAYPAIKGYIEKVDVLMAEWGCEYLVRQRNTLLMEGDGGPLTVLSACNGKTL